jgi:hypothetical protein
MNATTLPEMKKVLKPDALYFGDNGRCFCGQCAGTSALYTGHDISGQKVRRVTPKIVAAYAAMDFQPKCESCGRGAQ